MTDDELRREVESRLNQGASAANTPLAAGTMLGPYRIQGPLGAGGMGQVHQARD